MKSKLVEFEKTTKKRVQRENVLDPFKEKGAISGPIHQNVYQFHDYEETNIMKEQVLIAM